MRGGSDVHMDEHDDDDDEDNEVDVEDVKEEDERCSLGRIFVAARLNDGRVPGELKLLAIASVANGSLITYTT